MDRFTYFIGWKSTVPVAEFLMEKCGRRDVVPHCLIFQICKSRLLKKLRDGDGRDVRSRSSDDVWAAEYLPAPPLPDVPTLLDIERACEGPVSARVMYVGTPWMRRLWDEQQECNLTHFGNFRLNDLDTRFGPHLIYGPPPGTGYYMEENNLMARYCHGSISIIGDHGPNDVEKTVSQILALPSIIELREALKPVVGEIYTYLFWS